MRKTAKTLYLIAKIFNIIGIVILVFLFILGLVIRSNAAEIAKQMSEGGRIYSVEDIKLIGVIYSIIAGLLIFEYIVLLVIVGRAMASLDQPSPSPVLHAIILVLGVLGGGILYIIGGIVGLIAINEKLDNGNEFSNYDGSNTL